MLNYCLPVIALAGHPLWRSKRRLEVGGSAAFGYVTPSHVVKLFESQCLAVSLDHEFVPLGEYIEPRSVIEEYYGP